MNGRGGFYLGCPVWANKAWVGTFYPPGAKAKDYLRLYSRRLNTVEGNTTFYALPSADTVARWREDAAPGFRFCLKFPQAISHAHRLRGAEAETAAFMEVLAQLGDRCGPSFLQLPPTFSARELPALLAYLDLCDADIVYSVPARRLLKNLYRHGMRRAADRLHALRMRGPLRLRLDALKLRGFARAGYVGGID